MAAAMSDAVKEFAVLAEHLEERLSEYPVEFGYLEFATPIIRDGLDRLRAKGIERFLRSPACCLPQATPRTTSPPCSTPMPPRTASESTTARNSASIPRCCAPPATASRRRSMTRPADIGRARNAARRGRPRRLRSRRQFQCLEGHAHAVGGLWLRLGRDRLFGRHISARRAGARTRGSARLTGASWCSPISCSPASWCSASMTRPIRWRQRYPGIQFLKAPYLNDHPLVIDTFEERVRADPDRRHRDELPDVQVPHAGSRVSRPRSARRRRAITIMSRAWAPIIKETARGKASHNHGHHHHGHDHAHDDDTA